MCPGQNRQTSRGKGRDCLGNLNDVTPVVMIGKNPFFSISFLILLLLILALGTIAFMLSLALGGALIAYAGNRAVLNRLETQ